MMIWVGTLAVCLYVVLCAFCLIGNHVYWDLRHHAASSVTPYRTSDSVVEAKVTSEANATTETSIDWVAYRENFNYFNELRNQKLVGYFSITVTVLVYCVFSIPMAIYFRRKLENPEKAIRVLIYINAGLAFLLLLLDMVVCDRLGGIIR